MLLLFPGKLAVIRCESRFKSMSLRGLSVGLERQSGRVPLISGKYVSAAPPSPPPRESEGRYEERWNGVQTTTLLEREYYRADLMSHTYAVCLDTALTAVARARTTQHCGITSLTIFLRPSTTRSAPAIFMFCQVSVRLTRHAIRIDLGALFLSPHCSMKKYNNAANISSSRSSAPSSVNVSTDIR